MLRLLLTACWYSVIAGKTSIIPSNHTTENTITVSSDPWSPVVGDTEGDQALNFRATDLPDGNNGRRGEFGLVENIRKQLMQDNYDYTSNETGETELPDVSVTTTARTTERTMSITTTTTTTPSNTTFYSFRATHLLSTNTTKSRIQQMQMVSVGMPLKRRKGMKNQPTDAVPRFRAFDEVSHSPATKMTKNAEHQIEVSKKDLLFYMDDSYFSRKNAGTIYRRKYVNSDGNITTSTNVPKHVINGKQKLDRRRKLYDSRSGREQITEDDINQNTRRGSRINKTARNKGDLNNQNDVKSADDLSKTKYESGVDNQYDSQTIEYTENVSSQKLPQYPISKRGGHQSEESHNIQNNDGENASATYKNSKLKRKKKIKNTLQTSHENDSKDTEHYKFADRRTVQPIHTSFRRKNQLRKRGNRQNTKLLRKNTTRRNRKQKMQMNKKMERMAYNFEQFKKFKQQQRIQQQKRQQKGVRHKKRNLPIRRQRSKKIVRKKNDNRIQRIYNAYSRKHNVLGGLYGKSHEHEDQTKANDVLENQIDEKKYDKMSNTTVITGNSSDIKEGQNQNSQSEKDKNIDGKHDDIEHDERKEENHNDDLDDNPHDDMPHDDIPHDDMPHVDTPHYDTTHDDTPEDDMRHDDTPHDDTPEDDTPHDDTPLDELKDEHNIDQKDQDDKKADVDSIDNEELEGFNSRRMNNDDKNFTQSNKPHNQCNDSHQCGNQSAKKYKLLQVPVKGGLRRSNSGNRQIIQERDANGVALYAVDEGPLPQFRLPRDRRQYMDDHIDKRPPLLELAKKFSSGGHSGRRHYH